MTDKKIGKGFFIASAVCLIIFVILLCSCGSTSKKKISEPPKEGFARILGVYIKRDGTKQVDILGRQIFKNIKYDSASGKDVVVVDTAFGWAMLIKQVDSKGNIIKAMNGQDSVNPIPVYIPIGKDSVNWHIEGVSVDSLLKK